MSLNDGLLLIGFVYFAVIALGILLYFVLGLGLIAIINRIVRFFKKEECPVKLKPEEYALFEITQGLKLIASDFIDQESQIPGFAHIPDEIINAMPIDQLGFLVKKKAISSGFAKKIQEFYDSLDHPIFEGDDYEAMVGHIASSPHFVEVRKNAKELLDMISKGLHKPVQKEGADSLND